MPDGFRVNDFDHLEEAQQEGLDRRSGWGFTRRDLTDHHVTLLTDVRLVYGDDVPPEMRRVLAEASHVLHHIAEKAVMDQLRADGLTPVERKDILYGRAPDGEDVVIRASGWLPFEE